MENRLRFLRQTVMLLLAMFSTSYSLFSQFDFEPENQVISVDAGTCTATVDITPSLPGPGGANFPTIVTDGGSTAIGTTIVNSTVIGGTMTGTTNNPTITITAANGVATLSVTVEIMDNLGTSPVPTATFSIQFIDGEAPVLTTNPTDPMNPLPADATVVCLADAMMTPIVTAMDDCAGGVPVVFDSDFTGDCSGGSLVRTWTATDGNNNTATHIQTITITGDNDPPTEGGMLPAVTDCGLSTIPTYASVADLETVLGIDIMDNCTADADLVFGGPSDELAMGSTPDSCPRTYVRAYSLTDACDNVQIYTQTIIIDDSTPPMVTSAPADTEADCMNGPAAATQFAAWVANGGGAVVSDDCDGMLELSVTVNGVATDTPEDEVNMPCPNGTYEVEFVWTNDCGGQSMPVTATYTIDDQTSPESTGGTDVIVQCDGANNMTDFTAFLNNNGSSTAMDACSPLLPVEYVIDGNVVSIAEAQAILTTTLNNGQCEDNVLIDNSSTPIDNVLAAILVDFQYTDACNNFPTTQTVTFAVTDNLAPTITTTGADQSLDCLAQADIEAELTDWISEIGGASATDNGCGGASWNAVVVSGGVAAGTAILTNDVVVYGGTITDILTDECGNTGTVTIAFTVSDDCGNANTDDTQTLTFTVTDTTAPNITAIPENLSVECGAASATDLTTWLSSLGDGDDTDTDGAMATDVCSAVSTYYFLQGTYDPNADADNDPTNDAGYNSVSLADLSDECGNSGSLVVVFYFADACGNTSNSAATFSVSDTTDPTITAGPEDLTVECNPTNNETQLMDWIDSLGDGDDADAVGATATDNCGGVTWRTIPATAELSALCGATGAVVVEFIAIDDCGRETSAGTATFTVEDTTPPSLTANGENLTVECATDNATQLSNWLASNADDPDNAGSTGLDGVDACSDTNIAWFYQVNGTTVDADGDGNPSNDPAYSNVTLADLSDACGNSGSVNVDFYVVDACGNYALAETRTFTIQDTSDPIIATAPQMASASCDADVDAGLEAWILSQGNAVANDNCSTVVWDATITAGNPAFVGVQIMDNGVLTAAAPTPISDILSDGCGQTGTVTIQYIATDGCGNDVVAGSASFAVTDFVTPNIMPGVTSTQMECDNSNTANQDSLQIWLNDRGGAEANDNCGGITWYVRWIDSNNNEHMPTAGFPDSIPLGSAFPVIDNTDCNWSVTVEFIAVDDCNNPARSFGSFTLFDDTDPEFIDADFPADMTVFTDAMCMADTMTTNTGVPTGRDNCDTNLEFTYTDNISANNPCTGSSVITRTWTMTDDCSNRDTRNQVITVTDNIAPTFTTALRDSLHECSGSIDNTTAFINWLREHADGVSADNCSDVTWYATTSAGGIQADTVEIDISSNTVMSLLLDDGTTRFWIDDASCGNPAYDGNVGDPIFAGSIAVTFFTEDECENQSEDRVATFTVEDTTDPTMDTPASDLVFDCSTTSEDIVSAFNTWIANNGGATATDACGNVLSWAANPNMLTVDACPADTNRDVIFTVTDQCGNASQTTANFSVIDTLPPVFVDGCPDDVTIFTGDDESQANIDASNTDCDVNYTFVPPFIADGCTIPEIPCTPVFLSNANAGGVVDITSTSPGDPNVIVNDVTLEFSVPGPATTASGGVSLELNFFNLDGEFSTSIFTEKFDIRGEDGNSLGFTNPAMTQCANTTTVVTIASNIFNQWALDGMVTFTLVPLMPPSGNENEAINDICGSTSVSGSLNYTCSDIPGNFVYEYSIDGGNNYTQLNPNIPPMVTRNFDLGTTEVIFRATDCSGNVDSCSFNVTVEDNENPIINTCPIAQSIDTDLDGNIPSPDCSPVDVMLAPPSNIQDNCEIDVYDQTQMVSTITFTEHPNIDGYVMDTVSTAFTMTLPPPATGNALVEVMFKGDVDQTPLSGVTSQETLSIIGENGYVIGTTGVGPNCGATMTNIGTFSIPIDSLVAWGQDGTIDITAAPVFQTLLGVGVDGNYNNDDFGINPCGATTLDGSAINVTDDGATMLSIRLSYQTVVASYCVSGATTVLTTEFPMNGDSAMVSLNPGTNTIKYKVADIYGNIDSVSCTYTVEVGNPTLPSPDLEINDNPGEPKCPGDFVVLDDVSNYTGTNPIWTWYLDVAPIESNAAGEDLIVGTTTSPSITFQALPGENVYYAVINDNLCNSAPSDTIGIQGGMAPTKPQIFASPNSVCSGEDFGLFIANNAPEWVNYQWIGSNGYGFNGQFPPAITGVNNTSTTNNILTYILTVTSFTGCMASDTVLIEVKPIPEQANLSTNSPICNSEDIVLTTSATCDNYQWIGPNGASTGTLASYASTTTSNMTTVPVGSDGYAQGMWSVICLSNNGCSTTSAGVEVIISNPISAAPSNNGPACEGESIQLSVGSVGNAIAYEWDGENGFSSTNQNPIISNPTTADAGTYTVTITDANGCTGTGSTEVAVSNIPAVTAISVNPDANSCVTGDTDITLNPSIDDGDGMPGNTGGPYTYNWTGENGFNSTLEDAILPNGTSEDNGSYVLVISNAAGCVSEPFTVVVDVKDTPTPPALVLNNTTLCQGDDLTLTTQGYVGTNVDYEWFNGTTSLGTTSTPSFTIVGVSGSDAGSYSVMVTVDGCPSNTSQVIPVTVNAIPMTPVVTAPSSICEGDVLQLETPFVSGADYVWTGPNGFTASVSNPSIFPVTAAAAGGYSVQVIVDGCPSALSSSVNVAVSAAAAAPTLTNNGPICIDQTGAVLTLNVTTGTATPGAAYEWFDAQTNNSLGMSGLSTNFNINNFDDYGEGVFDFYVVATVAGCPSSSSVPTSVVINSIPNQAASAGTDIVACDGLAVSLDADAPTIGMGTWTQVNGPASTIANPNAANTSITGLAAGSTYTFRWTLSNGACGDYSSDDVEVIVNSANQSAEAGSAVAACNSGIAVLAAVPANSGNIGTWTQSATQSQLGVVIVDSNDPNTEVTGLVAGNIYEFTWTLSNNACGNFSDDIVTVTIEDNMLNAYAGEDFIACGGGDATILAEPVASCTGSWSSPDPELVFADNIAAGTVVMDLKPGENILVWTVDCGPCGSSTDMLVITFEPEAVTVPDVANVSFNGSISVDVTANDMVPTQYTVSIINNPSYGILTETATGVYTYTHDNFDATPDQFTYQVCNANCPEICSEVTTASIIIDVSDDCIIPTIITPNSDNINDAFVIECLFASGKYPNNTVAIYNQWGDEVFRASPYANNWEGTYNGEELPVGTYYYYVDLGDGSAALTGFLIIER